MTTWLPPADVEALTHRRRWSAQARALDRLGIAYSLSAEGGPLVPRDAAVTRRHYRPKVKPAKPPR